MSSIQDAMPDKPPSHLGANHISVQQVHKKTHSQEAAESDVSNFKWIGESSVCTQDPPSTTARMYPLQPTAKLQLTNPKTINFLKSERMYLS